MSQDIVDGLLSIDYVRTAIPFFFILIFLELAWDRKRKLGLYRFGDTLSNMGCGAVQILTAILTASLLLNVYRWLHEGYALTSFQAVPLAGKVALAVLLFLGVDLAYYWGHRFSHRVHFAWGGHGVHHQSEEYNLSVALRQSAFQVFFTWFFYLPLAVFGFSTAWYISMSSFVTMYQFWIHTRLVKTLGPLELVLNTPSHHRVHHAINGRYIDKNYAGTLIIWDKIFGTFVAEERECVYGTVKPLQSFNPVWAQVAFFKAAFEGMARHKGVINKLRSLIAPPGWRLEEILPDDPKQVKFECTLSRSLKTYVFLQFALLTTSGLFLLEKQGLFTQREIYAGLGVILLGFLSVGFLLDQKKWAPSFEAARLFLTLAVLGFYFL